MALKHNPQTIFKKWNLDLNMCIYIYTVYIYIQTPLPKHPKKKVQLDDVKSHISLDINEALQVLLKLGW